MSFARAGIATMGITAVNGRAYYRKDTGARITVHHLLTHTSGLPMFSKNPLPEERLGAVPVREYVERPPRRDH